MTRSREAWSRPRPTTGADGKPCLRPCGVAGTVSSKRHLENPATRRYGEQRAAAVPKGSRWAREPHSIQLEQVAALSSDPDSRGF